MGKKSFGTAAENSGMVTSSRKAVPDEPQDNFHEMEWDMGMLWQLRGQCGNCRMHHQLGARNALM